MARQFLRRDLIVRIDGSVRFACLANTALADAIWERLPHYGAAERTQAGALAMALDLETEALPLDGRAQLHATSLGYCVVTRRIVFPGLAPERNALVVWAVLSEPFAPYALDTVPSGARLSLLHADS